MQRQRPPARMTGLEALLRIEVTHSDVRVYDPTDITYLSMRRASCFW